MSFLLSVIKTLLPDTFEEAQLYEPFCEQVAALHAVKLQADLMNAEMGGNEEKKIIELDEEDKEEIIKDFLWVLYSSVKTKLREKPDETSKFLDDFYEEIAKETYSKEVINVPVYNYSLSKRKGGLKGKGKKVVSKSSGLKVINPLTGSKIGVDGRLFNTLVKNGLLFESGEMTEEGLKSYNKIPAKRKRIDNPIRKGKINMGGKAYQTLLDQGYFYNEKTEQWIYPKEEAEEEAEEAEEEAEEETEEAEEVEAEDTEDTEEEAEETEEAEEEAEEAEEETEEAEEEAEEAEEETEEAEEAEDTEEETEEVEAEDTEDTEDTEEVEAEDTEEETDEETEEVEEEEVKKPLKKTRQVSEKIPHAKYKSRQIVKDGKAHRNLEAEGWSYNDEEGTWSKI